TCRPLTHTLLPYTTLFRSSIGRLAHSCTATPGHNAVTYRFFNGLRLSVQAPPQGPRLCYTTIRITPLSVHTQRGALQLPKETMRSEEHTSELQSRENLVCR